MWPAMCEYCEVIMGNTSWPIEQRGGDYLQLINCIIIIIIITVRIIQYQVIIILYYFGRGLHSLRPLKILQLRVLLYMHIVN